MALLLAAGVGPGRLAMPPTAEQTAALDRSTCWRTAWRSPCNWRRSVLLPRLTGVRPWQIGLTLRRFGWNCLWGVAGWAVLTPTCLAVNYAVVALYGPEAAGNVKEHPFVQMAQQGLTPLGVVSARLHRDGFGAGDGGTAVPRRPAVVAGAATPGRRTSP